MQPSNTEAGIGLIVLFILAVILCRLAWLMVKAGFRYVWAAIKSMFCPAAEWNERTHIY